MQTMICTGDSLCCIREEPQLQKMGEYVFHMERMLNEMKFFRQKKQETKDRLQNEYDVAEEQEAREQVYTMLEPHLDNIIV